MAVVRFRRRRGAYDARIAELLADLDRTKYRTPSENADRRALRREAIQRHIAAARRARRLSLRHALPPMQRNPVGTLWNGWKHKMPDGTIWEIPAVTDGARRALAAEAAVERAAGKKGAR